MHTRTPTKISWTPINHNPQNTWLSSYPYCFRTSCILLKSTVVPAHVVKAYMESRGIAPFISNIVNFTPRPLDHQDNAGTNYILLYIGAGGPHSRSRPFGEEKTSFPCRNSNPEPSSPYRSPYTDMLFQTAVGMAPFTSDNRTSIQFVKFPDFNELIL